MTKKVRTLFSIKNLFSKQGFEGRRFVIAWFVLVMTCTVILISQIQSQQQQYNAGLLGALEIDSPKHIAAIALGKNYQNKLLLLVGDRSLQKATNKAKEIRDILHTKPWLDGAYTNPLNSEHLTQLIAYYANSPFSYLSQENKKALEVSLAQKSNQNGEALNKIYFDLLNQWSDPVVSATLPHDVTLSLASFLKERLLIQTKKESQWQFKQQTLMLQGDDLSYVPIFGSSKSDYVNVRDSVDLYINLTMIKASVDNENSSLLMTGLMLHTASASLQAQHEISSFGVLSLIGVVIIILLAFKALTPLLACLAVIATSLILGLVALNFFFDAIHLLAFVFSVSILGIAVDYGFHILVLRQYGNTTATDTRKKVFQPLTIALFSTVAGYSLFFTTPLNLLHQVVVFVGFGLLGAYASALLLLPSINLNKKGILFAFQPKQHLGYAIAAIAVLFFTFSSIQFNDSISALNTQQPALLEEESKIARLTGESAYPHMVLLSGSSRTKLLDETLDLATNLREAGAVLKSISDWQLSNEKQIENITLIKRNYLAGNFGEIESYLAEGDISRQLNEASPLPALPPFITNNIGLSIEQNDQQYWTALLLNSPLTIEQEVIVEANEAAQYINLPVELSNQLSGIRVDMLEISLPAMALIFIILTIYYGVTSGSLMMLVPMLSAGLAVVTAQLFQEALNIFNVLACLLILTLSVDYVVFFRAHGVNKLMSHTVSLSALSSGLTFGVMAFSTTPAVSSFGLTLLIGISLAWLLAHLTPLTLKKNDKSIENKIEHTTT
jgi:predicted exporter